MLPDSLLASVTLGSSGRFTRLIRLLLPSQDILQNTQPATKRTPLKVPPLRFIHQPEDDVQEDVPGVPEARLSGHAVWNAYLHRR